VAPSVKNTSLTRPFTRDVINTDSRERAVPSPVRGGAYSRCWTSAVTTGAAVATAACLAPETSPSAEQPAMKLNATAASAGICAVVWCPTPRIKVGTNTCTCRQWRCVLEASRTYPPRGPECVVVTGMDEAQGYDPTLRKPGNTYFDPAPRSGFAVNGICAGPVATVVRTAAAACSHIFVGVRLLCLGAQRLCRADATLHLAPTLRTTRHLSSLWPANNVQSSPLTKPRCESRIAFAIRTWIMCVSGAADFINGYVGWLGLKFSVFAWFRSFHRAAGFPWG